MTTLSKNFLTLATFVVALSQSTNSLAADKYLKIPLDCAAGQALTSIPYAISAQVSDDGFGNSYGSGLNGCDPLNVGDPDLKKSKVKVDNKGSNAVNSDPYSFKLSAKQLPKLKPKNGRVKIAFDTQLRMGDFPANLGPQFQSQAAYQFEVPINTGGPTTDVRITWDNQFKKGVAHAVNYFETNRLRVFKHLGGGAFQMELNTVTPQPFENLTLTPGEYVLIVNATSRLDGITPDPLSGKQVKFNRTLSVILERKL